MVPFDGHRLGLAHFRQSEEAHRFGDHSFFLNADGMRIVEPNVTALGEDRTGAPVTLAGWADETRSQRKPHAPSAPAHIVELGRREAQSGLPEPPVGKGA